MIILITVLLTLLAIIVIASVIVLIAAPLKITIRREQETAIEIEFGRYMRNVWVGMDWFSVTKVYLDKRGNVNFANFIISWFPGSKNQIDKLNAKARMDQNEWECELDPGD